MNEWFEHAILV